MKGQPLVLKCAGCRRRDGLAATGATRPRRTGGRPGGRAIPMLAEYACGRCGHRGWSSHVDMRRLLGGRISIAVETLSDCFSGVVRHRAAR